MTEKNILDYIDRYMVYKEECGKFFWKESIGGTIVGKECGSINGRGYWQIGMLGKTIRTHKLVWLYHNKKFPTKQIDHINRDKLDNRIINLREVCNRENQLNKNYYDSGRLPGSHLSKRANKYFSSIQINNGIYYLGCYDTEEEAHLIWLMARNFYGV